MCLSRTSSIPESIAEIFAPCVPNKAFRLNLSKEWSFTKKKILSIHKKMLDPKQYIQSRSTKK